MWHEEKAHGFCTGIKLPKRDGLEWIGEVIARVLCFLPHSFRKKGATISYFKIVRNQRIMGIFMVEHLSTQEKSNFELSIRPNFCR